MRGVSSAKEQFILAGFYEGDNRGSIRQPFKWLALERRAFAALSIAVPQPFEPCTSRRNVAGAGEAIHNVGKLRLLLVCQVMVREVVQRAIVGERADFEGAAPRIRAGQWLLAQTQLRHRQQDKRRGGGVESSIAAANSS